jgi:hypothetical protein
MNITEARRQYREICYIGGLEELKKLIKKYPIEKLDQYSDDSESLAWAFRRKHFDIVDYLLFNDEEKQYFKIPYTVIADLSKSSYEVTEYICNNEKLQSIFNIFDPNYYSKILKSACQNGLVESIEKLILPKESKDFWKEKMMALNEIASSENPSVKIFDTIYLQILNNANSDKKLLEKNLVNALFLALGTDNLDIASYLIIDKNIQLYPHDRQIIKESFPNGEKLFLARELNQSLSEDLTSQYNKIKKSNKL